MNDATGDRREAPVPFLQFALDKMEEEQPSDNNHGDNVEAYFARDAHIPSDISPMINAGCVFLAQVSAVNLSAGF